MRSEGLAVEERPWTTAAMIWLSEMAAANSREGVGGEVSKILASRLRWCIANPQV